MTAAEETAWLAGLLEGEGTFTLQYGPDRIKPGVVVEVKMADEDVIRQSASIMGVAQNRVRRRTDGRSSGFSDQFVVSACAHDAARVMMSIRPLMGERRGARIDQCLGARPDLSGEAWTTDDLLGHDIAWLAGLLEGEAYFRNTVAGAGRRMNIGVALTMTDRDVVERAASVMGLELARVRLRVYKDARHSDAFEVSAHSVDAARVMRSIRPFMGARRGERIDECLAARPDL